MDADLAVVIVSTNEARWLPPCLTSVFAHAGDISLDVVVADNDSVDGTRELVESDFPDARVVTCRNHGFGHANNRGLETTSARYVLFLNPDTEILDGHVRRARRDAWTATRRSAWSASSSSPATESSFRRSDGSRRSRATSSSPLRPTASFRFVRPGWASESST